MRRCGGLISGRTDSAWRHKYFYPLSSFGTTPPTRDQTQSIVVVQSWGHVVGRWSLVLMTFPVHTKKGPPRIAFIRLLDQIGPWHWTNGRWWMRHGVHVVWPPFIPRKSKPSKLSGPRHEMMSTAGRPRWPMSSSTYGQPQNEVARVCDHKLRHPCCSLAPSLTT